MSAITPAPTTSTHPARLDATLEPGLSRGLWLIKWLLVIPHVIVLFVLWLCFAVLTVVAFFSIVFTGRYPRAIFDFNLGVLRWSWRVAYYSYAGLGTDRYPPFSLGEVPDYPARLDIAYPERLSRGLVWVKSWLLAFPHLLLLAIFLGTDSSNGPSDSSANIGLISLLVLFAGVALLFTTKYPKPIFDFVMGLNRWVIRVVAYVGLMTDQYPPFRLDTGGAEPASEPAGAGPDAAPAMNAPTTMTAPAVSTTATSAGPAAISGTSATTWGAGRITALVIGTLALLVSLGLIAAGSVLAVADNTARDDQGYFMTPDQRLATKAYAITSKPVVLDEPDAPSGLPEEVLGDARLSVTSRGDGAVFVGVAKTSAVSKYLDSVSRSTLIDLRGTGGKHTPVYRKTAGGPPDTPPAEVDIWTYKSSGTGEQTIALPLKSGDWTVVVMNEDGTAQVSADVSIGATFPGIGWLIALFFTLGGLLLIAALALVLGSVWWHRPKERTTP